MKSMRKGVSFVTKDKIRHTKHLRKRLENVCDDESEDTDEYRTSTLRPNFLARKEIFSGKSRKDNILRKSISSEEDEDEEVLESRKRSKQNIKDRVKNIIITLVSDDDDDSHKQTTQTDFKKHKHVEVNGKAKKSSGKTRKSISVTESEKSHDSSSGKEFQVSPQKKVKRKKYSSLEVDEVDPCENHEHRRRKEKKRRRRRRNSSESSILSDSSLTAASANETNVQKSKLDDEQESEDEKDFKTSAANRLRKMRQALLKAAEKISTLEKKYLETKGTVVVDEPNGILLLTEDIIKESSEKLKEEGTELETICVEYQEKRRRMQKPGPKSAKGRNNKQEVLNRSEDKVNSDQSKSECDNRGKNSGNELEDSDKGSKNQINDKEKDSEPEVNVNDTQIASESDSQVASEAELETTNEKTGRSENEKRTSDSEAYQPVAESTRISSDNENFNETNDLSSEDIVYPSPTAYKVPNKKPNNFSEESVVEVGPDNTIKEKNSIEVSNTTVEDRRDSSQTRELVENNEIHNRKSLRDAFATGDHETEEEEEELITNKDLEAKKQLLESNSEDSTTENKLIDDEERIKRSLLESESHESDKEEENAKSSTNEAADAIERNSEKEIDVTSNDNEGDENSKAVDSDNSLTDESSTENVTEGKKGNELQVKNNRLNSKSDKHLSERNSPSLDDTNDGDKDKEAELKAKKDLLKSDSDESVSDKESVVEKKIVSEKNAEDTRSKRKKGHSNFDSDGSSTDKECSLSNKMNSEEKDKEAELEAKKDLLKSDSDDSVSDPKCSGRNKSKSKEKNKEGDSKKSDFKSSKGVSSSDDLSSSEKESNKRSQRNRSQSNANVDTEEEVLPSTKKISFKLTKNIHYKRDKKLRMNCIVQLKRLSSKILRKHRRALELSRQWQDRNSFNRLLDLDGLEKKRKGLTEKKCDDNCKKKLRKDKDKAEEEEEDTLLDHLDRVEQHGVSGELENNSEEDSQENSSNAKNSNIPKPSNDLITEGDEMAKNLMLESGSDSCLEECTDPNNKEEKLEEMAKKGDKVSKKQNEKSEEGSSSETDKAKQTASEQAKWRKNKLLTTRFSDSDTDKEDEKFKNMQEKLNKKDAGSSSEDEEKTLKKRSQQKRTKRRVLQSDDSDVKLTGNSSEKNDSDSDFEAKSKDGSDDNRKKKNRKRVKKPSSGSNTDDSLGEKPKAKRRRRIKKAASDSDSSGDDKLGSSQGTPGKSGRKNIRKLLKDKQVTDDTKQAAKDEEERLKRIAERQKLYNEMYEHRLAGEEKVQKLVLDFDEETKKELVTVHKDLVKRLKPHQAQGIKFMWDACFETLEMAKNGKGSGCILAHCMGLGKSFQVVTLTHTLLTHTDTGINTVMVVCPLNTVLNWVNEFTMWLKDIDGADDIEIYEMTKMKQNFMRKSQLENWQRTGGVMIIGYEMFRNLSNCKKMRKSMKEAILKSMVDPGPDLIICDEGHLLKNEDTALSKAMRRVRTLRRIVLTGTPLQNNLVEYHCMVQFVKPNLLGTKNEFLNRFVNPITNGQYDDSTEYDVKLMKKRAHILHKMLEGCVQRRDYSVLTPFLPPKQEYVIFVRLTEVQIKLYQYYLDNFSRRFRGAGGSLFADFQALQRIWTHPLAVRYNAEKVEKLNEKKRLRSDSEGSIRDFIDDDTSEDSDSGSSSRGKSSDSDDVLSVHSDSSKKVTKRSTRANPIDEPAGEIKGYEEMVENQWWQQIVDKEHYEDMKISTKLLILFGILKESEQIGDKVLVFSQSLYSLSVIEQFLSLIDDATQNDRTSELLDGHTGSWSLGLDYFRLDGQTPPEHRTQWCKIFNTPTNTRARLFLISTKAGGLGINLTAANRVVIFDASWNPSHDVQSIFRIYRFGQKKPCYVYRLLAAGTMEEKIYNRQVTKLSLSCRVVDEQQIERHYSNNDLAELYRFELYSNTDQEKPTLNLPKDRLLAEIFLKYKDLVENYHEHDSLLENKADEELDEEERKLAWIEYEEEKKGKRQVMNPMAQFQNANPMLVPNIQSNVAMHQWTQMLSNSTVDPGILMRQDYKNLEQLFRKDYPNLTPEQQRVMANRKVMEMYNYLEKQTMMNQFNKATVPNSSLAGQSGNPAGQLNVLTPYQIQQQARQQQMLRAAQQQLQQQQQQHQQRQFAGNPGNRVVPNIVNATIDDDIIEIPSTTPGPSAVDSTSANSENKKANNRGREE